MTSTHHQARRGERRDATPDSCRARLKSDLSDNALRRLTGDNPDHDFDQSDIVGFRFAGDHPGDCGVTLPGG